MSELARAPSVTRTHLAAFLALACVGLYGTSFGPAASTLADDFGVSLDRAGLLVTLLFAGSISASGAIALRTTFRDTRTMTAAGLVLATAGLLLLGLAGTWWMALVAALLIGTGDGLIVAGTHLSVAMSARDVAAAINRLNLWFTFGAVAGPAWTGIALDAGAGRGVVYGVLAMAIVPVVALTLASPRVTPRPRSEHHPAATMSPVAWGMAAVLFLYVGAEFGLGLWVASYATGVVGASLAGGALLTSGYWGALAGGRFMSGRLLEAGRDPGLVLIAVICGAGAASVVLALADGSIAVATIAAVATGFFFGPVWPSAMAVASRESPEGAPAALVTVGNAGGLAFPWLQGRLLVSAGPGTGVAMTAVLCAGMLALGLPAVRRSRR